MQHVTSAIKILARYTNAKNIAENVRAVDFFNIIRILAILSIVTFLKRTKKKLEAGPLLRIITYIQTLKKTWIINLL